MASSITLDLALVLFLQITASAVQSAITKPYNILQYTHIIVSTLAVLVYPFVIYFGYKRLTDKNSSVHLRTWHIRTGLLAFSLRSLGFLFMFSM